MSWRPRAEIDVIRERARVYRQIRSFFNTRGCLEVDTPLLMPTTLFVLINALLNAFKLVDHLFILTKGGPNNASNLLLYYIYETAFSFLDSYYAATLTVVMLVTLAVVALVQVRR